MGVGQRSCGQFIATISKIPPGEAGIMHTRDGLFVSENVEYQQWLSGFVSGFNDAHADDLGQQVSRIDLAGMDLWMRNWCNQHPTDKVFDGAEAFIHEMRTNAAAARR